MCPESSYLSDNNLCSVIVTVEGGERGVRSIHAM